MLSFAKQLKLCRVGDKFLTRLADNSAGATASRMGYKITTRGFFAIPIKAPHSTKAVTAHRITEVTIVAVPNRSEQK